MPSSPPDGPVAERIAIRSRGPMLVIVALTYAVASFASAHPVNPDSFTGRRYPYMPEILYALPAIILLTTLLPARLEVSDVGAIQVEWGWIRRTYHWERCSEFRAERSSNTRGPRWMQRLAFVVVAFDYDHPTNGHISAEIFGFWRGITHAEIAAILNARRSAALQGTAADSDTDTQ